jgi:O-antigen/teichoic acid export membrane protein
MPDPNELPPPNAAHHSDGALLRKAAAGSVWTSAQVIVNKLATAVAMFLVARELSKEEMGLATLTLAACAFLLLLPPVVIGDVLLANQHRLARALPIGRRLALRYGIASTLFLMALSPGVAWVYSDFPSMTLIALVATVAIRATADACAMPALSALRSDLRYRTIVLIDGGVQLATTALMIGLAFGGAGAFALIVPQVALSCGKAVLYSVALARAPVHHDDAGHHATPAQQAEGDIDDDTLARRIRHDFFTGGLGQYIHNALGALPALALGRLAGETETGIFGFAYLVAAQATVVISYQLGAILQPIFGRLGRDPAAQATGFLRIVRGIGSVAIPVSLLQAAFAPVIFALLFSPKYDDALPTFVVLSAAQCFQFAVAPVLSLLKAQGRFRTFFVWQAAHIAVAGAAFLACSGPYGALGVAIADSIVWGASVTVATWLGSRAVGLSLVGAFRALFATVLTALPVAVACWFACMAIVPLGAIAQVAAILVLGPAALLVSVALVRWSDRETFAALVSVGPVRRVLDRLR